MEEPRVGRRERRRRKVELRMEGSQMSADEFQKRLENSESSITPQASQSMRKLVRRDTYTVLYSKSELDVTGVNDLGEDFEGKGEEGSRNSSPESGNLTYSLNKDSESSKHCTYNVEKPPVLEDIPPVPAPRRRKSKQPETEKLSSDTDRDITEIDLDDPRAKLNISNSESSDLIVPIPKPRRTAINTGSSENSQKDLKSPPGESSGSKTEEKDKPETEDSTQLPDSKELPLISELQSEAKSPGEKQKPKKQRKLIGDLWERKGGKKRTFSSLMKLEKKKIPKISALLKDLKEDDRKPGKPEPEEEKTDSQTESPRYRESAHNGRIYVQGKNGFHVMERDEVLRNGKEGPETDGNGGTMEVSTVRTAVLFQRFWSRAMMYFHGVLAGIGFSHAAAVTALMLYCNYEPQGFVALYSCLSLKIHYVFYALTALCIVSCFDRVDIGHMNRRHWDNALKYPSTWAILATYLISFALTFTNQTTEARFDALPDGNETEIWDGRTRTEVQVSLLQWYHCVWARDILVLLAWLVIALTRFEDFLHSHINNMAKYANVKGEKSHRHKIDLF